MKLSALKRIIKDGQKRVGQGKGSGRGKKSGRGGKGQTSRNSMPLSFEGGALSIIKRLPFMRGKGKNKSFQGKPMVINVEQLNSLKKDTVVDVKSLVENKIISSKYINYDVKILGNGKLDTALVVKLPVSVEAKKKIEQAGGKIEA